MFIDELDAVGRKRGLVKGSGGQERDATLNQVSLMFSPVLLFCRIEEQAPSTLPHNPPPGSNTLVQCLQVFVWASRIMQKSDCKDIYSILNYIH